LLTPETCILYFNGTFDTATFSPSAENRFLSIQHLLGMRQGGRGNFFAAQHPGNFFVAVFFVQWCNGCAGSAF
jgi:hypothetical protein